jgi:hypothetical protein
MGSAREPTSRSGKAFYKTTAYSVYEMSEWTCGIEGCGGQFESADQLVEHQSRDHDPTACEVCGESVPAGFFAIRHAFTEHTRADYLRAYDADSDDIRVREDVLDVVEERADLTGLIDSLGVDEGVVSAGD